MNNFIWLLAQNDAPITGDDTIDRIMRILTVIGVIITAILGWWNKQQMHSAHLHRLETKEAIKEIHIATNSMKDQLVASTDKEAFARCQKDQKDRDTFSSPLGS